MIRPFSERSLRLVDTARPPQTTQGADSWKRIITVSNRLPFKISLDSTGSPTILPSSGGLVTAMNPLMRRGIAGKWVGWLGGDEDEGGLEEALRTHTRSHFDMAAVPLTPQEVDEYYLGYANQVLAPVFAEETHMMDADKAHSCWISYQNVQRKFADTVYMDLQDGDIVWVHDYHLLGVGKALRGKNVTQPLGFFLHMPFPDYGALGKIPQRHQLLRYLLAYDIVGMQTKTFARNFLHAAKMLLPNIYVTSTSANTWTIRHERGITRVGHFPISIDTSEFERQLYAADTQRCVRRLEERLRCSPDKQLIFNMGRSDYSKGFFEELMAFDRMLKLHPELVERVTLCQLVVPSRGDIKEHREYRDRIHALSKSLNQRYGRRVVRQIHAPMARARYLAHLHVADVLSVPSRADGMNLVCKEGAIVGKQSMVLLLGEKAGAAEELGAHALLVNPADIYTFAETLYQALTMPERERLKRKREIKASVTRNDVVAWWSEQEPLFQEVWDAR